MEEHAYRVKTIWTGGRTGILSSPEVESEIMVATPPNFMKGVAGLWSPEHLYTASAASCLMTTFLAIAANSSLDFEEFSCEAEGILGLEDGKHRMLEIRLYPELLIRRAADREKAERILNKSEEACLIARSMQTKITLVPSIRIAELTEAEKEKTA